MNKLVIQKASEAKVLDALSLDRLTELSLKLGSDVWRLSSDVAQVSANYLICHPLVLEVRYPGLRNDPLFATASCTLQCGFGPFVAFKLAKQAKRRHKENDAHELDALSEWYLLNLEDEHDARGVVLKLEGLITSQ